MNDNKCKLCEQKYIFEIFNEYSGKYCSDHYFKIINQINYKDCDENDKKDSELSNWK